MYPDVCVVNKAAHDPLVPKAEETIAGSDLRITISGNLRYYTTNSGRPFKRNLDLALFTRILECFLKLIFEGVFWIAVKFEYLFHAMDAF